MLKVNKVKLFTQLIIAEVFIIIVLISFFIVDSCIDNPTYNEIIIAESSLIYSKNNSVPFTGKMQDTLGNKLIVEYNVVDGFKQGEYILLTMEGNFAVKGFMNKNKNDGNWKYFYDNGQIECTGNFNNDKPIGMWTWFYGDGTIKCEGNYINGKEDGRWLKYDNAGLLCMIIHYRLGEVISFFNISMVSKV